METKITAEDLMGCNPDSILKLECEFIEEEDGSGTIQIEWDETDPDLQWWTDWGKEKQEQFISDTLTNACNNLPNEHDS